MLGCPNCWYGVEALTWTGAHQWTDHEERPCFYNIYSKNSFCVHFPIQMTLFLWFPLLFLGVVTSRTELIANKKLLTTVFKVRVQVLELLAGCLKTCRQFVAYNQVHCRQNSCLKVAWCMVVFRSVRAHFPTMHLPSSHVENISPRDRVSNPPPSTIYG